MNLPHASLQQPRPLISEVGRVFARVSGLFLSLLSHSAQSLARH
jgi:hypothetical protein